LLCIFTGVDDLHGLHSIQLTWKLWQRSCVRQWNHQFVWLNLFNIITMLSPTLAGYWPRQLYLLQVIVT